ncbi:type II toxin-antitoxin system ParD family antitoxin [uncultured Algibacter sp.]|uniref:type II toxin-antitoxin system ParD family antitoxin n=1 Tax=uncultured Algibacter sp. TaxID=298659 RepID=UPI0026096875|nr:type II toxin-antitoxin system ParD family antitoxin [uncultured Algibacter sp.]
MGAVRKSITFTEEQDKWIKFQIIKGDFTNDSEYIRALVRKDQAENARILELKKAIEDGLNSGISNKTVTDIITDVEATMKANGEL